MKHLQKTSLALLTVCALILCMMLCAANVSAAELGSGKCGDNLNWTLYDNGKLTITGDGSMWHYDPYEPAPWDSLCEEIVSVSFSSGITEIGSFAFAQCSNLTSISFPEGVSAIGDCAFAYCDNLSSVSLPLSIRTIYDSAFMSCVSLQQIKLPQNLETISGEAFKNCTSLQRVVLPAAAENVASDAFVGCTSLTFIGADKANARFVSGEGVLYTADWKELVIYPAGKVAETFSVQNSVTAIWHDAFNSCTIDNLILPKNLETINGLPFTEFVCKSFSIAESNPNFYTADGILFNKDRSTLICYPSADERTAYTVPSTVITIHNSAFAGSCNLLEVILPESVEHIDFNAFFGCDKLESITVHNKNTVFAFGNFFDNEGFILYGHAGSTAEAHAVDHGLRFEVITDAPETEAPEIPETAAPVVPDVPAQGGNGSGSFNNITWVLTNGDLVISGEGTIPYRAFAENKGIFTVTIEDSVTGLGYEVFTGCSNLNSVTIGNGITSIGGWAFNHCSKLENVVIPESVTEIGESSFNGCSSLTSINIPASVKKIGEWAFNLCHGLTEVVIPNGVRTIAERAFFQCSNLSRVTIPESVVSIGSFAFAAMNFGNKITEFTVDENNPYYSVDEDGVLYNKDKTVLVCYPSGKTDSSYTVRNTVTTIGAGAFYTCANLTSVTLPESVVSIEPEAFESCKKLAEITLPDNLLTVGARSFSGTALESISLPEGLFSVGHHAFESCVNLTTATVPGAQVQFGVAVFTNTANVTLHGYEGSTAEAYAAENNIPFTSMGTLPDTLPGDISADGTLDISDAMKLFQHSMLPTLYPIDYNGNVDLNKDGVVDLSDSVALFQHSMLPALYPLESEGVYAPLFKSLTFAMDFHSVGYGFNSANDLSAAQLIDIAYSFAERYDVDFTPYREYKDEWMYVDSIPVDVFNTLTERMFGTVPAYECYSSYSSEFFGYDAETETFRYSNVGGRSFDQTLFFDSYTVKDGKFIVKIKAYDIVYEKPEFGVEGEDWFYKFIWDEDAYFVFTGWQWVNATLVDGYVRIDSCTMP